MGAKKMICQTCKKETRALRQCRDCNLIFCPLCLTREYNTRGQVTRVYPECPRCRGANLMAVDETS